MADLTPIMISPENRRMQIRKKVVEGLQESFPIQTRNKNISVTGITVSEKDYSPEEQKMAILEGNSLFETVKGTVRLRDKRGNVIDEVKNFTLAKVPWFTPRHTFILGGNEYSVSNMVRPKPGVYARKRANGILEASFNTVGGKNFNVTMDPEKGEPQLEYGSTKIPLYTVLRKSGMSHDHIAKVWGPGLADKNKKRLWKNADKHVDKLYEKVVPSYSRKAAADPDQKIKDIFSKYTDAKLDPEVTEATLGQRYSHVTRDGLLDASSKVLKIFKDANEVDDRDNLDFKTLHSVDDFFKERIGLDARSIARKVAIKAESTPELRKVLPSGPFTKGLVQFINSSQLAATPTMTNPVELIDSAMRVTSLGEGGISSERAIPMEARQTHVTQIGALDPIRTPESFRAGVDLRAAMLASKDARGNIHVPLYDVKNGRRVNMRAGTLKREVVAFPGQKLLGTVDALVDGTVQRVSASKVRYQIPDVTAMYGPTTNLIPFLESAQGNRAVMGSKNQTQALSLVDREAPLVRVKTPSSEAGDGSMVGLLGQVINPTASVSGTVAKIDGNYIYIRPDKNEKTAAKEELVKVPFETNFPLASKTFLHHTPMVKPGDKVQKDQVLADSNFSRDGVLALGKNLSVAYMPYYGANSNDAVVISQDAAKKLTSERMYKVIIPRDPDMTFNKEKHRVYYGHNLTRDQYNVLDKDGVIKPGTKILPGDPVVAGLRKSQATADDLMLGRLHKSLARPFRDSSKEWDHDHPGEVVDVVKTPKRIAVTIKTKEPAVVGDKISGNYGNKGVVSEIVPSDQMIKDEAGNPVDIIMTSAGVVSRVNPSQIIEAAVGKVAHKTGKPILVENFSDQDNVKWAKKLLKENGVKDKETVYDPRSGKQIPNVFVGRPYIFKLFKSTDTNYGARSTGSYDVNEQPTKGGTGGSKSLGKMEFDALIGHNARNILREASTLKSQKNDEFWRAVQLGYPTPAPKTSFAADKFMNMLTGAGVKVNRDGHYVSLSPLTDDETLKMSSGEIKDGKLVRAKDLRPETGGLFDPAITGGLQGNKWAHIDLAEPVVNPMFREPVRRFLGMTNTQLDKTLKEKGGDYIKKQLAKINLDAHEKQVRASMKNKAADSLDNEVKQLKYITALKKNELTPDKAYVISKIPVVPPTIRPIIPGRGGQELLYGDINPLYRDLLFVNNQAKDIRSPKTPNIPGEIEKIRPVLQQAVGAVYGTNDPVTSKSVARGHKGFLTYISGVNSPKQGFFHSKLMKKTQDVSGRGTIVPDLTLGMDEVGIPEDMLWTMYEKFLIKHLVQRGYPAVQAKQMVSEKHYVAKNILQQEIKERPVMVNRFPSLHRFNIIAAFPKATPGKSIRINPFMEKGTNSDYDGDSCDSHLEFVIDGCYKRLHISECPHKEETAAVKGNKEKFETAGDVKVFGYSSEKGKVVLCDVTHFSKHHGLEMVEVTTSTGRKVKVSRDHSMFGMNPDTGKLERFKAEDGIRWGTPRPRKLYSEEQMHAVELENKELFSEVVLSRDFGWLIGAWAGDGWVSYDKDKPISFGLGKASDAVRGQVEEVVRKYVPGVTFGTYSATHDFGGGLYESKKVHAHSRAFGRAMSELTERCRGAENKRLPSYFVQGSREFLLGILGGLLDTDGSVAVVKAKAKPKPQFMVVYTTLSDALAEHACVVATMLGVKSNIYPYQKKKDGKIYKQVTFSTPDIAKIAHEIPCVHETKSKILKQLSLEEFDPAAPENARWDTVPISKETAENLRKLHGNASKKSKNDSDEMLAAKRAIANRYQKLTKAIKEQRISRVALQDFIQHFGEGTLRECSPGDWFDLVTNEDILWDFIESVEHLPGKHTAWDLTVPDGNTFMTSNQLIVYDTMSVHVPVTPAAVEDAKGMTLSNLIFGDQSKNDLLVFPQHEAIMGVAHASAQDEKNKPKRFKTQAQAMQAYKDGKITLGTRVLIG